MLNEISQTEKPMPHSLTYMWNLKKKNQTHKNRVKLWISEIRNWAGGGGGRMENYKSENTNFS